MIINALGMIPIAKDDLANDDDVVSNRYRVEISFSSGMSPCPIEAKSSAIEII